MDSSDWLLQEFAQLTSKEQIVFALLLTDVLLGKLKDLGVEGISRAEVAPLIEQARTRAQEQPNATQPT